MEIAASEVKALRDRTGAGVMECRNALVQTQGDMAQAEQVLKEKGLAKAAKKADRATAQGLIEAYIHTGGRIGSLIELNCETDFVARTDLFKGLARDLAMQVAACEPSFVSEADLPQGADLDPAQACLLRQPFIRDTARTVQEVITEAMAKLGENIQVRRFARFALGQD